MHTYRLIISCPDRTGIVAQITQFIAQHNGWIIEASQHADVGTAWFFMRYEIKADSLTLSLPALREAFLPIADEFDMQWAIHDSAVPKKVILMASRTAHCLADLLHRWQQGTLGCDIQCVISNHELLHETVSFYGIPYHHIPIDPADKTTGLRQVAEQVGEYESDAIVLARYMQIFPPDFCQQYAGKMINIHHSFLPSFMGADPYQQAHTRGVKLIGATCHYVTEALDAGPIIEQDVIRVNHQHDSEAMRDLGSDVERMVLARGLRYHLEDRVLLHGNKTVVFV